MRLRKGKRVYKLPAFSMIEMVVLERDRDFWKLQNVPRPYRLSDEQGEPRDFFTSDGLLFLIPVPDRTYKLTVRYFPPVSEV